MTSNRPKDRGSVLPLVLVVTVVLGLVVVGVARFGTANLRYGQVTERRADQLAAADAAMSYATNLVRIGAAECIFNDVAVELPTPNDDFNGAQGTVTCDATGGGFDQAGAFAMALTGWDVPVGEYLVSTQGGSNAKVLSGPVYMERVAPADFSLANNAGLEIVRSPLVHQAAGSPCVPVSESMLTDVDFVPDTFGPICTNESWYQYSDGVFTEPPLPPAAAFTPRVDTDADGLPDDGTMTVRDGQVAIAGAPLWSGLAASATDPSTVVIEGGYEDLGNCRVFYPGRYVRPPQLDTEDAYFVSGDYVFDFRDPSDTSPSNFESLSLASDEDDAEFTVRQSKVIAGRLDTSILPTYTISIDSDCDGARALDTGLGATFYMSGLAHFTIETQGSIEISPRNQGGANPVYVAIHALCDSGDPWCRTPGPGVAASTLFAPATADVPGVVYTQSGVNREMIVNGLVYAPAAELELDNVTGSAQMRFKGGMVVARATLQASTSASNFEIGVAIQDIDFKFRLIATGTDPSGRSTLVSSIIDYEFGAPYQNAVEVESWRVCDGTSC